MGIESPLVKGPDGKPFDKFYELPNGCICCTAKYTNIIINLRGELLLAIEYFIKSEHQLDYILIETNGLADPSSVIFKLNKIIRQYSNFGLINN
jgi:G3E family GTPase